MMPRKRGRPTIYSAKLATQICLKLAIGESLVEICREDKTPSYATVMRWLLEDYPPDDPRAGFRGRYARAREAQAELYADEMVEIADDDSGDVLYDLDGHPVQATTVRIQRHRLRVDTRKWIVSKLLPRYADKGREAVDTPSIPTETEVLDDRELARQVALILYRADPKRLINQSKE